MKYFIDTEFAEQPCRIDLISIAIVAEDGREFYAESSDFQDDLANDWVKANVLPNLWHRQQDKAGFNAWSKDGGHGGFKSRSEIAKDVKRFVGSDIPEFWGYYADYDWVVFCWLFGAMIDLPQGWPMYCRDLKQWADDLGGIRLPQQTSDEPEHNALFDARWNKRSFEYLSAVAKAV